MELMTREECHAIAEQTSPAVVAERLRHRLAASTDEPMKLQIEFTTSSARLGTNCVERENRREEISQCSAGDLADEREQISGSST